MARLDRYIVGLDIGTTKVCAVVAEAHDDGDLQIIGAGLAESRGQKKGVVVDIERTVDAAKAAVEEAELMAGVSVDTAWISATGTHIRGINSRGAITLEGRAREITEDDVRRVIDAASDLALPPDFEAVHLLPQQFLVDGQENIVDPVGMTGNRLEVSLHLVVASVSALQNLVNCANKGGIEVQAVVLESLASNEAVLSDDERELGVALLDIGGGTTDLVCFQGGTVCHTAVFPVGGENFTNDLSVVLKTPLPDAEEIKTRHGAVLPELVPADQSIEVAGIGGRAPTLVPRRQLCEILRPRAVEMLDLVRDELRRAGFADELHAGIVLTGGGALLEGLAEAAEQRFGLPVRVGVPEEITGLTDVVSGPVYSTAVGLALYGHRNRGEASRFEVRDPTFLRRVQGRVARWFGDLF
ncbi:MAG: cell division protein FtsA [Acidobacteria bacterium]|nr:cell division protein FtsA [Acidobacteriota bacterium]